MILYPAIDLLGGQVVRLSRGARESAVVYSTDPAAVAARWVDAGAAWLHVVDLDRAFGDGAGNRDVIRRVVDVARARGAHVQLGGGLRTPEDLHEASALGAMRLVVGTAAALEPAVAAELARVHGERLVVALDARNDEVVVHGWTEGSGRDVTELGVELSGLGVRRFLYTDVDRDGMGGGPDVHGAVALARATGADVIASGGVGVLAHVAVARAAGADGLVLGRALYEGRVDLAMAVGLAGPQK